MIEEPIRLGICLNIKLLDFIKTRDCRCRKENGKSSKKGKNRIDMSPKGVSIWIIISKYPREFLPHVLILSCSISWKAGAMGLQERKGKVKKSSYGFKIEEIHLFRTHRNGTEE